MREKQKSPIMIILLTFLTCGLYIIYWQYKAMVEMGEYLREDINPLQEILFCFLTCGLYTFYLYYKLGKMAYKCTLQANISSSDNSILYVILVAIGLGVIVPCFIQSSLNDVWEQS